MTDPGAVSPAAEAVDDGPPELWWSPTCGLFGYVDGMGTGDSIGPLHARANDAVRLVPAPGPDIEAGALKLLAELVELKDGPRDAEYRRQKPQVWQEARDLIAAARGEDPLTEHNGDEWFRRRVDRHGPCTCGAGPWDVCQEVGGCRLCTALPTGWPCVADGGYGDDTWIGRPTGEAAGVRSDGENPR